MSPQEYRELAKCVRSMTRPALYVFSGLLLMLSCFFGGDVRITILVTSLGIIIFLIGAFSGLLITIAEHMAEWAEKQKV